MVRILFVLILFGVMVAVRGIVYMVRRRRVGSEAAAKGLRSHIVAMGLYAIAVGFYPHLRALWIGNARAIGGFIIIALLFAFTVYWFGRRRRAGVVLLDLGRTAAHRLVLVGVILVAAGFVTNLVTKLLEAGGETGTEGISYFSHLAIAYSCLLSLDVGLGRNGIRERGVWSSETLVKWEHVEAYGWGGDDGLTLSLKVVRRLPFF